MENLVALNCPNCGAATTNHKNCEFCGSLLVRFVEKGIALETNEYISNVNVYPGLIDSIKDNLKLQLENPNELVATDIYNTEGGLGKYARIATITNNVHTLDGRQIFQDNLLDKEKGNIMISFSFHTVWMKDTARHSRFRKLDIYKLFSHYMTIGNKMGMDGEDGEYDEYVINFGSDVEGAARLISKVLLTVYKVPYNAQLSYKTIVGTDEIKEGRENEIPWYQKQQWLNSWWAYAIAATIGIVLFRMCSFD